jgi:hypothetical protein
MILCLQQPPLSTTINYEKEITMIPSMEDKLNKDYEVRVTKDYSHVTEIDYKYS